METVQVTRYKTPDGILFDNENEAKLHEIRLLQVKVFEAFAFPNKASENELSMIGYIYVNAKGNHEMFARWYMGQRFGNQVSFGICKFGSDCVCKTWEIKEVNRGDIADDSKFLVARIEDSQTSRIWKDSIFKLDQVPSDCEN